MPRIEKEGFSQQIRQNFQILKALVVNLHPLPIDVKIRLLPTQPATLALVSQLLATGVSALTVHCRTQDMRPREPALLERLREIVDLAKSTGIPVIANGDVMSAQDRKKIEDLTGTSSYRVSSVLLTESGRPQAYRR